MQKIALDLDGVVFDTENLYRVYTEIYDVTKFKKDSLLDNGKRLFQERYNWAKSDCHNFYEKHAQKVLTTGNIMTGFNVVLPLLMKKYEFIVVTSRDEAETNIAIARLKAIKVTLPMFFNEKEKITRLIDEGVNIIIDDDENICRAAAKKGIKAFYFKNAAASKVEEDNNFIIVNNWGEIYKYLMLYQANAD